MRQDEWSRSLVNVVADAVRWHRKRRGLSAQQLANECASLGYPVPRSVLANLESGRRETISLAELLVLSAALRVPLLLLLFPVGRTERIAPLPNIDVSPWDALQWAVGNRTLPSGDESPAELRDVDPTIGMFQAHQDEVAKALAVRRAARNTEQGESPEVAAGELQARVQGADFGVWFLRDRIRRTGLIPPDLPPELSHIDVNFHPPQLADLSLVAPE